MNPTLTVTRKEIVDGLRDSRSLIASLLYALMGPLVVGLVSLKVHSDDNSGMAVLVGMMAVFSLVSAFAGGMNVAMDTIAGERERKSLLPLLLNAVPRTSILVGKWLAVSSFAVAGFAINLVGFAVVFASSGMHLRIGWFLLPEAFGLFALPLLASAVQLFISTVSRTVKEVQTYLSLVTFVPMGMGMFLVFCPAMRRPWCSFLPLVGQQMQLEALMSGRRFAPIEPVVLGHLTLGFSVVILLATANRLQRDEIIYGN
jgi:sodium transport system permease protein